MGRSEKFRGVSRRRLHVVFCVSDFFRVNPLKTWKAWMVHDFREFGINQGFKFPFGLRIYETY